MSVEALVQLVQEIERPLRVTKLDLEGWSTGTNDACLLGSLLLRCPSLTRLSLARNSLTDEAVFSLASCVRFLQESSGGGLRELNLSGNSLTPDGCEAVARSFFPDASSQQHDAARATARQGPYTLDLSRNPGVGDAGAAALAIELKTQGCLGSLFLEGSGLCSAGFASLAVAADCLVQLDLSGNSATSAVELAALLGCLSVAPSLESLGLSDVLECPATAAGPEPPPGGELSPEKLAEMLAGALRRQESRLQRLALAGNKLDGRSLQLLLEAARQGGGRLKELDLDRNCMGASWKGAELRSLIELLTRREPGPPRAPAEESHWGLRTCSLCGNGLDDAAAALLAEGLRQSVGLEVLRLSGNAIRDRGAECLADALKDQRALVASLQEPLRRNTSDGDLGSADAVPRCSGVAELQIARNALGDGGLEALAVAASSVPSLDAPWGPWGLAVMDIEGNAAGSRGQAALRQAQRARVQLLQQLLRALSGQRPPSEGGGAPPPLLRVGGLPAPDAEEVALEVSLARHWAEHYGPAAWPAGRGECGEGEEFSLEQELRMAVADREAQQVVQPVDTVHVKTSEAPDLVTVNAEKCGDSPSWLSRFGFKSLFTDPNAPDALDEWYNEEEPASRASGKAKSG